MIQRPVAIVGAGPAGMAAALVLSELGLRPTVLDENPRAGGQIYRQPPPGRAEKAPADRGARHGAQLCARFAAARTELLTGSNVWSVFPERRLAFVQGRGWQMIAAEQLVLCTGAYEYTPPFPGWTLPGVMTPGGAQSLVKTWNVRPGRRAVVAGSGPFLLVVARQLQAAGVEVRAVLELARRREFLPHAPALLSNVGLLGEGFGYLRGLKGAGIPLRWGHVVCAAEGDERGLRAVTLAPCDAEGAPDRARLERLEVDTLAVGYGFVPRTELAQLAGCELEYRDELGGWLPRRDAHGETSASGVWVAGDGGGVSGSEVAELEGQLVGLGVALRLGLLDAPACERRRRPLLTRLARLRRFRAALDAVYRVRPGLTRLAEPTTLVCRCEELSAQEVDAAGAFGGSDYRTLKIMTRLGMGPCQGRMCWPAMTRRLCARTGCTPERVGQPRWRPPIRPTTLGDLLEPLTLPAAPERAGDPARNGHA